MRGRLCVQENNSDGWRYAHEGSLKEDYTGCPRKNVTLFWRAVAPLNFELGIKVGGVLESSGSQL